MRAFFAMCGVSMLTAIAALAHGESAPPPPFRVIVDPGNGMSSAPRSFVADAFLKKVTRWNDGEAIHPVDLTGDSAARRKFSEDVLGRSVSAVRSYWQQLIFAGRELPPPELDSDAAVVQYVLKHRGSIGYVSSGADVGAARVLNVK